MPASKLDVLCQLPANILCVILSEWVDVSAFVRLQIAAESRTTFAGAFRSDGFKLKNAVDVSNDQLVSWLREKGVKSMHIKFTECCSENASVLKYLRYMGHSVRSLDIQAPQTGQLEATIAAHCKNISKFRAQDCEVKSTFTDILVCNPNLQEIRLDLVRCDTEGLFDDLQLHHLRVLSARDCILSGKAYGFPWSATAHSDSLEQADFEGANMYESALFAVVENCPKLKSLGMRDVDWEDAQFQYIVKTRPTIVHLDVHGTSISDCGMLAIATNLMSLRSIACQDCDNLTNTSLLHLANNSGATLEVLYTDIRDPGLGETVKCLEEFCSKVVVLHTLSVCTGEGLEFCASGGTYVIARGCVSLKRFMLDGSDITESSRKFINELRPELKISPPGAYEEYKILDMTL